ncbi:hypothetical protein RRG08_026609 [Elysia crispata]|uniref:Uncharacterized protein n=1 Tax=Elysia crispata TaxID=231223 RepID=A0AAE1E6S7_9GAST|nr:hypothetical protein RRG08_026609 [Elysia crispata]
MRQLYNNYKTNSLLTVTNADSYYYRHQSANSRPSESSRFGSFSVNPTSPLGGGEVATTWPYAIALAERPALLLTSAGHLWGQLRSVNSSR